ncbi:hypothetical protein NMY22_g13661 [Coprinellus aureogranulatus]|nr:hypothetical protein NMY22_g13661 [Coprinellus aureogranulatus]
MSALANGTYFISSIIGGGDRYFLGFSSGATGEALVLNPLTASESIQWDVQPSNIPNIYAFRNRRYQTYISVNPPDRELAGVVAASEPKSWYVTSADSGYLVGIDGSASLIWNVNGGTPGDNVDIILFRFQDDRAIMNEFWKFRPIENPPSSSTSPSTALPSSTSSSAPSSTCSCPAKEGMDLGDKIGLGVGLGVGIPTLLVAIVALFKDSPLAKLVKGEYRSGYNQLRV